MKSCNNCKFGCWLYREFWCYFERYDLFYCNAEEKICDRFSVCAKWERIEKRFDLSKQRFDEVIEDIGYLKQFAKSYKTE